MPEKKILDLFFPSHFQQKNICWNALVDKYSLTDSPTFYNVMKATFLRIYFHFPPIFLQNI